MPGGPIKRLPTLLSMIMDLPKIKTLIDFVGKSPVSSLFVTEDGVTVRIFKTVGDVAEATPERQNEDVQPSIAQMLEERTVRGRAIRAPVFGILHRAPAPGEGPFVEHDDTVEEGQTLFIIEAMKVFNKIAAPCAGRVTYLTATDGGEVDVDELLAEIA